MIIGTRMEDSNEPFERLSGRYRAPLLAFFSRRIRDSSEVEDLAQEVLLKVLRQIKDGKRDLTDGYIFTAAANLLRDRARRRRSGAADLHLSLEAAVEDESGFGCADGWTENITPESVLFAREVLSVVVQALQELSSQTRDVFLLFRLEGLKQRDIAKIYGVSVSAIEKHICKAMKHISERAAR